MTRLHLPKGYGRGRELVRFGNRWSLNLQNPRLSVDEVVDVRLPIRQETIHIHPGATWHGINSNGRCIDLVFASADLISEM